MFCIVYIVSHVYKKSCEIQHEPLGDRNPALEHFTGYSLIEPRCDLSPLQYNLLMFGSGYRHIDDLPLRLHNCQVFSIV